MPPIDSASGPGQTTKGSHREPPPQLPSFGSAMVAYGLFIGVNALVAYLVRPLLLGGLCLFFSGGGWFPIFLAPLAGVFVLAWSLPALLLRRLNRKYRVHFADAPGTFVPSVHERHLIRENCVYPANRTLRCLRVFAFLVLIVDIGWFLITVGLLLYASNNTDAYAWKMCFPELHH
jgi:hypothetical protein